MMSGFMRTPQRSSDPENPSDTPGSTLKRISSRLSQTPLPHQKENRDAEGLRELVRQRDDDVRKAAQIGNFLIDKNKRLSEALLEVENRVSVLENENHDMDVSMQRFLREKQQLSTQLSIISSERNAAILQKEELLSEVVELRSLLEERKAFDADLELAKGKISEYVRVLRERDDQIDTLTAENEKHESTIKESEELVSRQKKKIRSLEAKVTRLEVECEQRAVDSPGRNAHAAFPNSSVQDMVKKLQKEREALSQRCAELGEAEVQLEMKVKRCQQLEEQLKDERRARESLRLQMAESREERDHLEITVQRLQHSLDTAELGSSTTSETLKSLKSELCAREQRIRDLESEISDLRLEIPELREQISQLENHRNELQDSVLSLTQKCRKLEEAAKDEKEKAALSVSSSEEVNSRLRQEFASSIQGLKTELAERIKTATVQTLKGAVARTKVQELEAKVAEMTAEHAKVKEKLTSTERDLTTRLSSLRKSQGRIRELKEKLDTEQQLTKVAGEKAEQAQADMEKIKAETSTRLKELRGMVEVFTQERDSLKQTAEEYGARIQTLEHELKARDADVDALRSEVSNKASDLDAAGTDLAQKEESLMEVSAELEDCKRLLEALRGDQATWQQRFDSERALRTEAEAANARALDEATRLAKSLTASEEECGALKERLETVVSEKEAVAAGAEEKYQESVVQIEMLNGSLEKVTAEREDWEAKFNAAVADHKAMISTINLETKSRTNELKRLEEENQRLADEVRDLDGQLAEQRSATGKISIEATQLRSKATAMEATVKRLNEEETSRREECEELKQELQSERLVASERQARITRLEADLSAALQQKETNELEQGDKIATLSTAVEELNSKLQSSICSENGTQKLLDEERNQTKELKSKLEGAETQMDRMKASHEEERKKADARRASLEQDFTAKMDAIEELNGEKLELQDQIKGLLQKVASYEEEKRALASECDGLRVQLKDVESSMGEASKRLELESSRVKQLSTQLSASQEEFIGLESAFNAFKVKSGQDESRFDQELKSAGERTAVLEESLKKANQCLADAEEQYETIMEKFTETSEENQSLKTQLEHRDTEVTALQSELLATRGEVENLSGKLQAADQQLECDVARWTADLAQSKEETRFAREQVEELNTKVHELQDRQKELTKSHETDQQRSTEALHMEAQKSAELETRVTEQAAKISELNDLVEQGRQRTQDLESSLDAERAASASLKTELDEHIHSLEQDVSDKVNELRDLKEQWEADKTRRDSELSASQKETCIREEQVEELNSKVNELQDRLKELTKSHETEQQRSTEALHTEAQKSVELETRVTEQATKIAELNDLVEQGRQRTQDLESSLDAERAASASLKAELDERIHSLEQDVAEKVNELRDLKEQWEADKTSRDNLLADCETRLSTAKNSVLELSEKVAVLESKLSQVNADKEEEKATATERLKIVEEARADLQAQVAEREERITMLVEAAGKDQKQIDSLQVQLNTEQSNAEIGRKEHMETVSVLQSEISEKTIAYERVTEMVREKDSRVSSLELNIEEVKSQLLSLESDHQKNLEDLSRTRDELACATQTVESVRHELSSTQVASAEHAKTIESLAEQLNEKNAVLESMEKELEGTRVELNEQKDANSLAEEKCQLLQREKDILEGRIGSLEEQLDLAVSTSARNEGELKQEVSDLTSSLATLKCDIERMHGVYNAAKEDISTLQAEVVQKSNELQEVNGKLSDMKRKLDETRDEYSSKAKASAAALQDRDQALDKCRLELDELRSQTGALQGKYDMTREEFQKLCSRSEQQSIREAELETTVSRLESELNTLQRDNEKGQSMQTTLSERIEGLESELASVNTLLQAANTDLKASQSEAKSLRLEVSDSAAVNGRLEEDLAEERSRGAASREERDHLKVELRNAEKLVRDSTERITNLESDLSDLTAKREAAMKKLTALEAQLRATTTERDELLEQVDVAASTLGIASAGSARGAEISSQIGKLVREKSTVVRCLRTQHSALEALYNDVADLKAARATILSSVDKWRRATARDRQTLESSLGKLVSMLSHEKESLSSLEDAHARLKEEHVTTCHELDDAISERDRIRDEVVPTATTRIKQLEDELEVTNGHLHDSTKKLDGCSDRIAQLERNEKELQEMLQGLRQEHAELEKSIAEMSSTNDDLRTQLAQAQGAHEKEAHALENERGTLTLALSDAEEKCHNMQERVMVLERQLEEGNAAHGEKVSSLEQERDRMRDEIRSMVDAEQDIKKQLCSSQSELDLLREDHASTSSTLREKLEEIDRIQGEQALLEKEIEALRAEVQEKTEAFDNHLTGSKSAVEALEAKLDSAWKAESEARTALEQSSNEYGELEKAYQTLKVDSDANAASAITEKEELGIKLSEVTDRAAQLTKKVSELDRQLAENEQLRCDAESTVEDLRGKLSALQMESERQSKMWTEEKTALEEQAASRQCDYVALQGQLNDARDKASKGETRIEELTMKLETASGEVGTLRATVSEAERRHAEALQARDADAANLQADHHAAETRLREEIQGLQARNSAFEARLQESDLEKSTMKQQLAAVEMQLDNKQRYCQQQQECIAKLESELESERSRAKEHLAEMTNDVSRLTSELSEARATIDTLTEQRINDADVQQSELQSLTESLGLEEGRCMKLEEEVAWLQLQLQQLEGNLKDKSVAQEKSNAQEESLRRELDEKTEALAECTSSLQETASLLQRSRTSDAERGERIHELGQECKKLTDRLEIAETQVKTLTVDLEDAQSYVESNDQTTQSLEAQLCERSAQAADLEESLSLCKEKLAEKESSIREFRREKEMHVLEMDRLRQEVVSSRTKLEDKDAEMESIQNSTTNLEKQLSQVRLKLENSVPMEKHQESAKEIETLKTKIAQLKQVMKSVEESEQNAVRASMDAQQRFRDVTDRANDLETRLGAAMGALESINKQGGGVLEKFMRPREVEALKAQLSIRELENSQLVQRLGELNQSVRELKKVPVNRGGDESAWIQISKSDIPSIPKPKIVINESEGDEASEALKTAVHKYELYMDSMEKMVERNDEVHKDRIRRLEDELSRAKDINQQLHAELHSDTHSTSSSHAPSETGSAVENTSTSIFGRLFSPNPKK